MALQPIQPKNQNYYNNPFSPMKSGRHAPSGNHGKLDKGMNTALSTTYMSSEKMTMSYTNQDGDSVTLSMEHVEYQQATLSYNGDLNSDDWKEIVDKIKDEYMKLQAHMIKKFVGSLNGNNVEEPVGVEAETAPMEIEGLPEYWNAENTSQRIVDFATSFFTLKEGSDAEYYQMMKSAIEEGFNQAMGILGELPDEVNALAQNTFELSLEKLEAWAIEQGINIGEEVAEA